MIGQGRYIVAAFLMCAAIFLGVFIIKTIIIATPTEQTKNIDPGSGKDIKQLIITNTKGESLFKNNCAACHSLFKDLVGPSLKDIIDREPWNVKQNLYDWIHNPSKFMVTNDYARKLHEKFGVMMQAFPSMKEEDIDAIVEYIKEVALQDQALAIP